MGWTSYYANFYDKRGRIDWKRETRWNFVDKWLGDKVIADSFVGKTYYAAVREDDGSVWCLIVKTATYDNREFCYKDMDETMGYYEYNCPKKILDLLTPTDNEWANEWREKCREYQRDKKQGKTFETLPEGTRAKWVVPWDCLEDMPKGTVLTLVKKRQGWRRRSPFVWHIEGTASCFNRKMVPFDQLVFER